MKLIDLSHPLAHGQLNFPFDPKISVVVHNTVESIGYNITELSLSTHQGGEMPVILASGGCGVLLHEAIGHGLEADFNRKGTSQYSDMLGKKVADPSVTIVDQATLPNERGALNYDDEGNECGRTRMIENGVLRSYLHDSISSAQYNIATTGSGRRESYLFAPMPRMTCTFMENGTHEKDEIVAAVDRGVIVENITEAHVQLGVGD